MSALGSTAEARFGRQAVNAGRLGEAATVAQIVASEVWAGNLFHPVEPRAAAGFRGDIDHVIISGRQVIFIDSKKWRGGHFARLGGLAWRDGKPFPAVLGRWMEQCERYYLRRAIETGVELMSIHRFVVIQTDTPESFSFSGWSGADRPIFAHELMAQLDDVLGGPLPPDEAVVALLGARKVIS